MLLDVSKTRIFIWFYLGVRWGNLGEFADKNHSWRSKQVAAVAYASMFLCLAPTRLTKKRRNEKSCKIDEVLPRQKMKMKKKNPLTTAGSTRTPSP